MVVENKTELSKDECFQILNKNAKNEYLKKIWVMIIIFLIGIPVLVVGLVNKETMYIIMGSLFIALSLGYLIMTFVNIKRSPKQIYARNKEICEFGAVYEYKFRENIAEIIIKSGNRTNKLKLDYTDIRKIIEFDSNYQIKFSDEFVIYVDKKGFLTKKHEELFRKNIINNGKKKKHKIIDKKNKKIA